MGNPIGGGLERMFYTANYSTVPPFCIPPGRVRRRVYGYDYITLGMPVRAERRSCDSRCVGRCRL